MSESPNDSLLTIPNTIRDLLPEHSENNQSEYSLSRVARIINRSIPEASQRSGAEFGLRRGHFTKVDPNMLVIESKMASFGWTNELFSIYYEGIVLPGLTYGEHILNELDTIVNALDTSKMSEREKFMTAAFISIAIGSTHPFPDANGRTAVGTAEYFLRSKFGIGFDMNKLISENRLLMHQLTVASYFLLPEDLHPSTLIQQSINSRGGKIEKRISKNTMTSEELSNYMSKYVDNLLTFIRTFDPSKRAANSLQIEDYVQTLADLYKRVSE